jgi:hypothetical protein
MTNATDILAVGGPANGRMWCLNRNAQGFPTKVEVLSIDPAGMVTYVPRKWWDEVNQRWYWIATWSGDEPDNNRVWWEITVNNFQPAWDLRDAPAPQLENGNE